MHKKHSGGMGRRSETLSDCQLRKRAAPGSIPEELPLVHVTAVWNANEIVSSGELEARHCPVFSKNLLYFFVLRPAYRGKDGNSKSHQIVRFPTAFIVAPSAVPLPFHVYPFDTGGAVDGAYSEAADPYTPLEDYELESAHRAAAGHIGWAFGRIEAYYNGELRSGLLDDVPAFETVTRGFVDIAQMGRSGSNVPDKRASTVEIAASHHIKLAGNVLLAIFPKQLIETPQGRNIDFIKKLGEKKIDIELYNWQPNTRPDEFQEEIARITRKWLPKWLESKRYKWVD